MQEIRDSFDQDLLCDLEDISADHAKIPSAVTERIFQLNALNPAKYRPRQAGSGNVAIQINFGGFQVPKFQRSRSRQVEAHYEVQSSKPERSRQSDVDDEILGLRDLGVKL